MPQTRPIPLPLLRGDPVGDYGTDIEPGVWDILRSTMNRRSVCPAPSPPGHTLHGTSGYRAGRPRLSGGGGSYGDPEPPPITTDRGADSTTYPPHRLNKTTLFQPKPKIQTAPNLNQQPYMPLCPPPIEPPNRDLFPPLPRQIPL